MKILHIGKYYWPQSGGMETAVKNFSELSATLGHSPTCVVSQSPKVRKKNKITINDVPTTFLANYGTFLSAPLCPGYFTLDAGDFDVVHLHLPNPLAEFSLLFQLKNLKKWNIKLLPYLHALPINQGVIGRVWFSLVTKHILDQAESILVSNFKFLESFPTLQKWQKKLALMPFYAKKITYADLEKARLQREQEKTIFAIGRLVPYKGFDVLIQAWKICTLDPLWDKDFKLLIAGDGPERKCLQKLINDLQLTASVRLCGKISEEEKSQRLTESTLLVAPSINNAETFGICILEGMSYGLPVITTKLNTGVSELARSGDCGAVVNANSVEDLSTALIQLLLNPKKLYECGYDNLNFVQDNFSEARARHLYSNLLAKYS